MRHVDGWDTPTRISMSIAVVLLALMFALVTFGGDGLQVPALVGIVTLALVIQGVALWGNRRLVTPFTQAQRHYLQGQFDKACELLERLRNESKAGVQELTLLGNTYRQMGLLDDSASVLEEALQIAPEHHFPLYGFGRTLLVTADYEGAAETIQRALELGAPPVVRVDLAEAYYRAGDLQAAVDVLDHIDDLIRDMPDRQLMVLIIRSQLDDVPPEPPPYLNAGLQYWRITAGRFANTPYSVSLADDLKRIRLHFKS